MKIGRNDPCHCGSGQKYKKCCLEKDQVKNRSLDDIMGPPHDPEDSLRRKIVNFSHQFESHKDHFLEAKELWGRDEEIDMSAPDGQAIFLDLMDYFIHDYLIPGKGKPILNLFFDEKHDSLPSAEMSILEDWLDNYRGFYEVEKVRPGEGINVQDVFTGEKYAVYDKSSTRVLQPWDIFYGRLMKFEGHWTITGSIQPIQRRLKNEALNQIKKSFQARKRKNRKLTLKQFLKTSLPAMRKLIIDVHEQNPIQFRTSTGEAITPTEVFFEIFDMGLVEDRLEAMNDFAYVGESSETPGAIRYDWLQTGASARVGKLKESVFKRGVTFLSSYMPGSSSHEAPIVLGNLTLSPSELKLSCMSQERADQMVELLEKRLGSLIQFKKSKRTPLESKLDSDDDFSSRPEDMEEIPQEIQNEVMGKFYEKYYEDWKNQPVPALSGLTPVEASKDPKGRQELEELLKYIENTEAHQKRMGKVVYGVHRLRRELGLAEPAKK